MDQMMPEMDGLETTAKIRAMGGRLKEIPIIALTANAMVGARETLISAGMNDFLAKPIQRDELTAILAKWVPVGQQLQ
jgi:CheY-like chemotaxis protein